MEQTVSQAMVGVIFSVVTLLQLLSLQGLPVSYRVYVQL